MAAELDALSKALANPARPLVAIVAGSKVSTKLTVLRSLAAKVDALIVGGGIANTFIAAANGRIGKSLAEPNLVPEARAILDTFPGKVPIPVDAVCAKALVATAKPTVKAIENLEPDDDSRLGPRLLPRSRHYRQGRDDRLERSRSAFEFDACRGYTRACGYRRVERVLRSPGAATLSPRSTSSVSPTGFYISTAGGAFLEFLEGATLPAVATRTAGPLTATTRHPPRTAPRTPCPCPASCLRSAASSRCCRQRLRKVVRRQRERSRAQSGFGANGLNVTVEERRSSPTDRSSRRAD